IFVFLSACIQQKQNLTNTNMEKINLTTEDQKNIAANFFPADTNAMGIVLIHQMRKSKESYDSLAPKFVEAGFNALAIDMRGHGESWGDRNQFSDAEYSNIIFDIKAAVEFLKNKNPNMKINLIGASISANNALKYAPIENVVSIIALSPGLDYHGVVPEEAVKNNSTTPILLVATDGDTYSRDSVTKLFSDSPLSAGQKEIVIYDGNAHGTDIFDTNKELLDKIIEWLKKFN
ncbi:alpha/beta fold hydrolase, partial [Candidatus Falkowbacteria bacterium]|nr:alpha/beta fold hydrolase [Candidatus Falkowbacteria bacterium]